MKTRLIDLQGVINALRSIEGVNWADARIQASSEGPNEIIGMVSSHDELEPTAIMRLLQAAFPAYCLPHRVVVVREVQPALSA